MFFKSTHPVRRQPSQPADKKKVGKRLWTYEKLEPRHLLVAFNFMLSEAAQQADGLQLALEEAATEWTTVLNDNVAVALEIDFLPLEEGVLGVASPNVIREAYDTVRTALQTDIRSTEDESAVANLSQESNLVIYINFTEDNPSGAGSDVPYVDNDGGYNNQAIELTSANARALGFDTPGLIDASIAFSNQIAWDFDRSDGIDPEQFDFVGVTMHEIGHALGFVSTVAKIDFLSGMHPAGYEDAMPPTSLDLYRHSITSEAFVVDLDLTVGGLQIGGQKLFKFDGLTRGTFSTGLDCITCDGNQANHWKGDVGGYSQGIMDPTIRPGELGVISDLDLLALDVIGWDLKGEGPAPDPCDLGGDTNCTTADLDALFAVFNSNVPPTDAKFDLNLDYVVDAADLDEWLSLAATENGYSSPYLRGDTDLDRDIDLGDYSRLTINFSPSGTYAPYGWRDGNFDGDGNIDLSDYTALASNFRPTGYDTAAVPEPSTIVLASLALIRWGGSRWLSKNSHGNQV